MNRIKRFITTSTTPDHLGPQDGIHYWQERVLLTLLLSASFFGALTWIPSVYLAIKEGLMVVAIADTLVLGFVVFLFFNPGLPYTLRAVSVPFLSYVLGLILLFTLGPFGAGPVWLFFFPVLTAVLLGPKFSVWALIVNAITVSGVGYLIQLNQTELLAQFGFKPWHIAFENPVMKWVVISANFMLLNILSSVSVTIILNGLHKSVIQLTASEKKHRQIFENILDVYFEITLDGQILEISPSVAQISTYTPSELRFGSISQICHVPDQRKPLVRQLFKEYQVNGYELDLTDKTGTPRTCSINARLIRDAKGEPDRIIGILRDVSEQKAIARRKKELEERLNRSQKMEALGMLAGGVAHDLNNVLSGIVTYPEILLMDQSPNSAMAQSLKVIHESGMRATEIVQDLLTLSRRGVVTREVVDFNQIVTDFLRTPEYEKILSFHPNVRVTTDIGADSPLMKGSAVHLQKTVMNLVSNAAEAQPGGGIISINTENRHLNTPVRGYDRVKPGDYIVLSVTDYGQGIAPEDLKRIFEPFFTKKVMGRSGTGLGMAVVWGTVQDHEGYIDVTSTQGQGTRFDLYFPTSQAPLVQKPRAVNISGLMGNAEKILIVDDASHQREIATTTLRRLRYETDAVDSGEAAVEYLKTNDVDLVLLDMIMDPGIDGLETYRRILDIRPGQRAVIASGFSRTRQVREAMELGAGQYIRKPYTLEKIGTAVKNELERG
ncbi:MAG: response regulator [Desulfobacterales bacterium]|nr:response regulator [Desulfobacterales bacterium]